MRRLLETTFTMLESVIDDAVPSARQPQLA
jgi:hypothetical protein